MYDISTKYFLEKFYMYELTLNILKMNMHNNNLPFDSSFLTLNTRKSIKLELYLQMTKYNLSTFNKWTI